MKTVILFVFTAIFVQVNAQNVTIPDFAFKSILVGNPAINTNGDGEIQVSEATAYTDSIFGFNAGIGSLQGIEAFTNLTFLNVAFNNITAVDLSQNTQLKTFIAPFNSISTIDVTGNSFLEELIMWENNLTSIDVTLNPLLRRLELNENSITALDISQNPLLEQLYISGNAIGSLDVSIHANLYDLEANGTFLTSLDISNNPLLKRLSVMVNDISHLDFSQNVLLEAMRCDFNEMESLDLSMCPNLYQFGCFACDSLTTINLQNGNNAAITNFQANNSPNIECVLVDDVAFAVANWSLIDNSAAYKLDCFASLNEEVLARVHCYPNPTTNHVDLAIFSVSAFITLDQPEVFIFDLAGKVIFSSQLNVDEAKRVDLSDFEPGTYIIKAVDGDTILSTEKLVVQ